MILLSLQFVSTGKQFADGHYNCAEMPHINHSAKLKFEIKLVPLPKKKMTTKQTKTTF